MRTHSERASEIKDMPTEELRHRFTSGGFGELRSVAQAELEARDKREESDFISRTERREDEAISIARKALAASERANELAFSANSEAANTRSISRRANIIAITAAILATAATIIAAVIGVIWASPK